MTTTAYDTVCARLAEHTGGSGRGGAWPCPAHDDGRPSLSVSPGGAGVVVHCHAGCSTEDVVAALGLTMADLFDTPKSNGSDISATYDYTDENGTLLFQVVRKAGKEFRQRRPDGAGGWVWKLGDTRRVLYRLPQVVAAVADGDTVFVVEGEKDADRLTAEGYVATCNPHGASKWRPDYNATLADATVIVIADRDEAGYRHARDVARQLDGVAASVKVVEAAEGKDVSDHLTAGLGVEALVIADTTNGNRPVPNQPQPDEPAGDVEEEMLASWAEVDLSAALRGDKIRPAPTILARSDGRCLFYEGQINYLHGSDGVGKSFVALFAAVFVLEAGWHVVWLDWEDPDETTIVARLLDLGVAAQVIAERFHYVRPETEATPTAVALVCDLARRCGARLVVVDSVGEAFGLDGVNEDKDNEVTPWMRRVLRPLAATGAAVLPVDHGVKNSVDLLHPSGSKRKRAQVTGSHFLVESPRPLSREFGGGQLKLTTAKDRHGHFTRGKPAATIDVTIYPDGGWSVHIDPPPAATVEGSANDLALARAMVRVVQELHDETGEPPSLTMIEQSKRVKGGAQAKRAAVEYAAAIGALDETQGPRRARLFTYVKDIDT